MLASIEHNNSLIRRVRVDIGFRSRRRDYVWEDESKIRQSFGQVLHVFA